jgi:hypothetical protein
MKNTTRSVNLFVILMLACSVFLLSSCSKENLKINISDSLKQVDTAKMMKDDYFEEGTVLAGIREHSWQGDLYRVPFNKSTIKQAASKETKNEALINTFDGKEYWTKYIVYQSKPAQKDDLKVGMLVMVCGDNYGKSFKEHEKSNTWELRKVKDLSELYKNIVKLQYYDTYWNQWKDDSRHLNNVRVIEGEFSASL